MYHDIIYRWPFDLLGASTIWLVMKKAQQHELLSLSFVDPALDGFWVLAAKRLERRSALAWLTSSTSSHATLHSPDESFPTHTSLASRIFLSIISDSIVSRFCVPSYFTAPTLRHGLSRPAGGSGRREAGLGGRGAAVGMERKEAIFFGWGREGWKGERLRVLLRSGWRAFYVWGGLSVCSQVTAVIDLFMFEVFELDTNLCSRMH